MHEDDFKNDDTTAGDAECFATIEGILCREHEAGTRFPVDFRKCGGGLYLHYCRAYPLQRDLRNS